MRVISGSAGGLRLATPKSGLRPTMDRVKAAIFSMLGPSVVGARALDLFAGSGALGIEALSRGAASATFVDAHPASAPVIRANLAHTRLSGRVETADVFRFLERAARDGQAFDLVFADPPYALAPGERDFGSELVAFPPLAACLAPDGLLVLEQLPGTGPRDGSGWTCQRLRHYGKTEVAFLARDAADPAPAP
jgi:16S rRNA (guanine966-N2)-methyltransferase